MPCLRAVAPRWCLIGRRRAALPACRAGASGESGPRGGAGVAPASRDTTASRRPSSTAATSPAVIQKTSSGRAIRPRAAQRSPSDRNARRVSLLVRISTSRSSSRHQAYRRASTILRRTDLARHAGRAQHPALLFLRVGMCRSAVHDAGRRLQQRQRNACVLVPAWLQELLVRLRHEAEALDQVQELLPQRGRKLLRALGGEHRLAAAGHDARRVPPARARRGRWQAPRGSPAGDPRWRADRAAPAARARRAGRPAPAGTGTTPASPSGSCASAARWPRAPASRAARRRWSSSRSQATPPPRPRTRPGSDPRRGRPRDRRAASLAEQGLRAGASTESVARCGRRRRRRRRCRSWRRTRAPGSRAASTTRP